MKFLFKIIKNGLFSAFLLYGYNLIAVNFNMVIPINIYTIGFVAILGIPSIISLILFKIFILWGEMYETYGY
jgi:inhibitor of the pro-sigma K processing machinery